MSDGRGKHGNHVKGKNHYRWSEDRMVSEHGYIKIRVGPEHPLADPNGYAYEHLIVWVSAGRSAPGPGELLHHDNENKTDNRLENLKLKSRYRHSVEHRAALTDEQVQQLRENFGSGEHTGIIAHRYAIPIQLAWKIVRGKTRRQAGGPIVEIPLRRYRRGIEHNGMPT